MKPLKFKTSQLLHHAEICDSSAAVAVGLAHFVVADDEDNILRVFEAEVGGKPIQQIEINHFFANNPKQKEVDIEGVAELEGVTYWITSHGRNKNGKQRPERHQFFATRWGTDEPFQLLQVGQAYTQLVLRDIVQDERLAKYNLTAAEQLPPKAQGGLNIEGLTATPNGSLLIGFRNPIPEGKALVLPLLNPAELVNNPEVQAVLGDPIELNLGGLGIRSVEYWASQGVYLIVAGAYDGLGSFVLYQWDGVNEPQPLEIGLPAGFNPEGMLFYPSRASGFQLLSDDGMVVREGELPCKEVTDTQNPHKYFRSLWLELA